MRPAHLRFAYASVVPSERTTVGAIYCPKYFRLVRDSGVVAGKKIAARRCLYRYVPSSDPDAIRRNLFRLR